jgi:hypothetical protein
MEALAGDFFCLACGWSGDRAPAGCPACGAPDLARALRGALVSVPRSNWRCHSCGGGDRPLAFRATRRVASLIWFIRIRSVSGYWCKDCARKRTALSLAYTGLVGWWGFFGAFYWAPRATYENWRAVWKPPRKPLKWGALAVADVALALEAERAAQRDDRWSAFDHDEAAESAP